jgi:hypothetical protein
MSLPKLVTKSLQILGRASPPRASTKTSYGRLMDIPRLEAFDLEYQEHDCWCWAAVGVGVANGYDQTSSWTQCTLANDQLNKGDCCNPVNDCGYQWCLENTLSRINHFASAAGTLQFEEIYCEISGNRPVACRMLIYGTWGHFLLITGAYTDGSVKLLHVEDPKLGPSCLTDHEFRNGYKLSSTWTDSFYTK